MNDPALLMPEDLATCAGISLAQLVKYANDTSLLYEKRRTKIIKGKARPIDPPTPFFRRIGRKLHRFLSRNYSLHHSVHGGAIGRSCFTAAARHVGRSYVITRDISQCYPSIHKDALLKQLLNYGFNITTAELLSDLFLRDNQVAQGSPLSTDALNFFFYSFDRTITQVCRKHGGRVTRTYDDIVISTNNPEAAEFLANSLEQEIESYGLKVNQKKRAVNGLQLLGSKHLPRVHNLLLDPKKGVTIPLKQRQNAVQQAEAYLRGCKCVSPNSLEGIARRRQIVMGHVNHMRQARMSNAKHVYQMVKQGDALVHCLLVNGRVAHKRKWWLITENGMASYNEPKKIAEAWRFQLNRTQQQHHEQAAK